MLVFRTDGCLSISKPRTIYDFLSVLIATASHAQDFFSFTHLSLLYFSLLPMKAQHFHSIHAQHMSAAYTGTTARGHEAAASMACVGMEGAWSQLPRHGHGGGAVVGRSWRTEAAGSSCGTGMAASGSQRVWPLWVYMHCVFLFLFDFYRRTIL